METTGKKVEEFRKRVVAEWAGDETAAAWQKHYAAMKTQMAEVTKALVEAAEAGAGMTVLDLASGTGEPSLSLARRVAPGGKVVATDLSEGMLAALQANARAEGVANIETRVVDAIQIPFEEGSFDRVTARFGIMFFSEVEKALGEIRRVLRPGGKVAFLVWGAPGPGTYFGAAVMPYMKRMAVKPDPDGPGPMRYAEPGKLKRLVEAAGFVGVGESIRTLPAPFSGRPEELLDAMFEIAVPFRNAVATLSEEAKGAGREESLGNLRALYDGSMTNVKAPVLIVTGTKG